MARPKVHKEERRTTGLKLRKTVHDALRRHNAETGIPMNRTTEIALERLLIEEGYLPNTNGNPTSLRGRAVLKKGSLAS